MAAGLVWASPLGEPADDQDQRIGLGAGAAQPAGCEVEYALRMDSGRTFDADVTVLNTGATPVADWRLSFTFPGDQTITDGAAVDWRQDGQEVELGPARGPAAALAPGVPWSLRLTGEYVTGNPLPVRVPPRRVGLRRTRLGSGGEQHRGRRGDRQRCRRRQRDHACPADRIRSGRVAGRCRR